MKNLFILFSLLIFISSCEKKGVITYPEKGNQGDNILSLNQTLYSGELNMTAEMTRESILKITIEPLEETSLFGLWYYDPITNENWIPSDYNNNFQQFEAKEGVKKCDMTIGFNTGKYIIKIYETNDRTNPRVKEIEVQ